MSKLREECGVFGIYSTQTEDVASSVYYGLFALQHRGQESCGIVVNDDGLFTAHKENGLVNDVFTAKKLQKLGMGNMALGHVRYGAAGTGAVENAQPLVVNHVKGRLALAQNGCLTNSAKLRKDLELEGAIFHSTSDMEVIAYEVIRERLTAPSIEEAINRAMNKLEGAYSLVVMSPSKLIAARDEAGFRPLCYGIRDDGAYVVASESCALHAVGAELVRDIEPGEILIFDKNGPRSIKDHCGKRKQTSCVFEYIYFARPDSVIDGASVHEARLKAGAYLAMEHPVDADIVIGVPDSGLDAAIGYSRQSGIPYGVGLIKNRYIGRTFISPGQASREDKVRIKLNPVYETVKGKRVVLIDDSIVRGTTCARIVKLLRDAGATEIHMMVTAPPFIAPCYYGTDVDSKDKLIACKLTHDEIVEKIGVDSLGFISLESTKKIACGEGCKGFCTACFDEKYPTEIPENVEQSKFDKKISKNGGNE